MMAGAKTGADAGISWLADGKDGRRRSAAGARLEDESGQAGRQGRPNGQERVISKGGDGRGRSDQQGRRWAGEDLVAVAKK